MRLFFQRIPPRLRKAGEVLFGAQAAEDGAIYVKSVIRSQLEITPSGDDIPGAPCDSVFFGDATLATMIAADDEDGEAVSLPYKAGWHPFAARRVLSVSPPVTVAAGWHRKRPAP